MRHLKFVVVSFAVSIAVLATSAEGAAALPGTGDDAGKTVVYRDTWGVPHIYAPTAEAGLYAMGWAQAEDRPVEVLKNMLRSLVEMASVDGPDALGLDKVAHMWDLYNYSKAHADRIRPEVRGQIRAFARGMAAYYAAHPQDVPEWWGHREIDEYMVIAFGRLFLQSWSFDDGFDDLKRGGVEPNFDRTARGSNQWAVSPARSAEKAAILLIDPHLGWLGMPRFWELEIHAGALQGGGFTLAGVPYIALGHNENMAWAMTTGGPDTADVYELTLNADDPSEYLYDGNWRKLTSREVSIAVKEKDPIKFTLWESHYGPIVATKDGKAYALKSSYADAVQGYEAWYELNFAKDYHGAEAAMATQQFFPQNVMVADTSGNIYYQRTGRVPKRPAGFDWSRPVNGSTPASEWLGIHPSTDHLQVLNPPQGYMQNCNIPPDSMMVNSPFSLEKTRPYLFATPSDDHAPAGWTTQRGARAVELLQGDDSVTIDEAKAYATDIHPYGVERWIEVLNRANAKSGEDLKADADYSAGIAEVLAWDRQLLADSRGALKYFYWRKQLVADQGAEVAAALAKRVDYHLAALGHPAPPIELSDDELRAAAASFAHAMAKLRADFGSLDKVYGDVFRVGRDDQSWPVEGGGEKSLGMTTLREVGYSEKKDRHTYWGNSGQTSTQIIVLTKPVQAWTYVPLGQSDRADSPHYRDQAEKLFSARQMKRSWWTPEELADHVESRTVLPDMK